MEWKTRANEEIERKAWVILTYPELDHLCSSWAEKIMDSYSQLIVLFIANRGIFYN